MNRGADGDVLYLRRGCGPSATPRSSRLPASGVPPASMRVEADDFQHDVDRLVALIADSGAAL